MTRTRPLTLLVLALVGAAAAIVVQIALAAAGQPRFRPEFSLALTLLLIGVVLVVLAVPVRRSTRGERRRPVDPFYATRVVLLGKASALTGALLTGAGVGLLVELLLRSGAPNGDLLLRTLAMLGGAIALLVAGLIAEWLCTVPPDEHGDGAAIGPRESLDPAGGMEP